MVRFLVVYETPADPAAFDRHYRDVHIPLVRALPGLRRFTISRNAAAVRGGDPFHLVAELEWDSLQDLQDAFASPQGRATSADVANLAPDGAVRSMVFELDDVL